MKAYTLKEAAEKLGKDVKTIQTWAKRHGIGMRDVNGDWRFTDAHLLWLEQARTRTVSGMGLQSLREQKKRNDQKKRA